MQALRCNVAQSLNTYVQSCGLAEEQVTSISYYSVHLFTNVYHDARNYVTIIETVCLFENDTNSQHACAPDANAECASVYIVFPGSTHRDMWAETESAERYGNLV